MMNNCLSAQLETLGMMIQNPGFIKTSILKREYFHKDIVGLYDVIIDCYNKLGGVDMLYLYENKPQYTEIIDDLMEKNFTINANRFKTRESYIVDYYKNEQARKMCAMFVSGDKQLDKLIDDLNKIDNLKTTSSNWLTEKDIDNSLKKGTTRKLKLYRYPKINSILELAEHDYIVIGANTGRGKSAFALNLMDDLSRNYPCLYFNCEITEEELHYRMLAINSGIEVKEIEKSEEQSETVKREIDESKIEISKRKIKVINGLPNLNQIEREISASCTECSQHMIVFIDHMLLIQHSKRSSLRENVNEIATTLRKFSSHYNITLIALCQLNRASNENRQNGKPYLSALKESGEIENSANKVMFLYYDDQNNYKLSIAKNRSGSEADFNLNFNKRTQQIFEQK